MSITLERYHGLENDYLVLDPNKNDLTLDEENVMMICNRNMGLGADGVLEGPIFTKNDQISVKIWNPDGSIAKQSGNGVRIFAKYLKDAGYVTEQRYELVTDGGVVEIAYLNEEGSLLKVSMGTLSFKSSDIPVTGEDREVINEDMVFGRTLYPVTCVSVGNPHCVIPVEETSRELVCRIGKYAENAKYFPEQINTEIMHVIDREHIQVETFERGAGYTLATGTGACAAAGVAYKLGLTGSKMSVLMPGGTLQVEIEKDWKVFMMGEVSYVAKICLSPEFEQRIKEAR